MVCANVHQGHVTGMDSIGTPQPAVKKGNDGQAVISSLIWKDPLSSWPNTASRWRLTARRISVHVAEFENRAIRTFFSFLAKDDALQMLTPSLDARHCRSSTSTPPLLALLGLTFP